MSDFDPSRIAFPQSFELRVIYSLDAEEGAKRGILDASAALGLLRPQIGPGRKRSERYGIFAFPVTFTSHQQLSAFYEALGGVPGVKAVL